MKLLLLILCFLLIYKGQCQPWSYYNYTTEEGLPSDETYRVFEDNEGLIWIGTDHGVARYDGYEFEVFTTNDGLPDNTIFNFYQDHKGRIWFFTLNGKVGFYRDGKFHNLELEGIEALVSKQYYIIGISVSEKDQVFIQFGVDSRT